MESKANKGAEFFKFSDDWKPQEVKLKEEFPQLSNSTFKLENGIDANLINTVETRFHKKREEIINSTKKELPAK